jgi:GT2 family glycosyltransferase
MNPQPLVSVVVLNWNGESLFPTCIAALKKTEYAPLEIILADNGSSDHSLSLAREIQNIKIVDHGKNLGYAAGNNRALGCLDNKSKYVCFLNNDIEVSPSWLNYAIRHLEENPMIGVLACRNMNYYDRNRIDGLYHYLIPYFALARFGRGELYHNDPLITDPGYVLSALGSSAIFRKDLFTRLGGFDESFYSYYEDADLCLRIINAGYRCLYDPTAEVFHMDQASFKKNSILSYYYSERNRLFFIKKNFSRTFIRNHTASIIGEELRQLKACLFGGRDLKSFLKARRDALRHLHRIGGPMKKTTNERLIGELIARKKIPL